MHRYIRPIKFIPYLKETIWGGEKIASLKGISTTQKSIGESWEISGVEGHETVVAEGNDKGKTLSELIAEYREDLVGVECFAKFGCRFPLLVKFIDAKKDLSIQVHPDDKLAQELHNASGKCEMWYVLSTDKDAIIYTGLSKAITPEEYERRVADDSIVDIIAKYRSKPGDVFYLPSGRIHSIGAGNLLLEIQQTSDITYRIYDFNRVDASGKRRELHTDWAKRAIDFAVYPSYHTMEKPIDDVESLLVKEFCFDVRKLNISGPTTLDLSECKSFLTLTCIDGETLLSTNNQEFISLKKGETILIPANADSILFKGKASVVSARL